MKTAVIKLKEIKDVYDFVSVVTAYPGDIDIVSGRYRVNAKSIIHYVPNPVVDSGHKAMKKI